MFVLIDTARKSDQISLVGWAAIKNAPRRDGWMRETAAYEHLEEEGITAEVNYALCQGGCDGLLKAGQL